MKAKVYLGNSAHIVKCVRLVDEHGNEHKLLPRYVHVGTIVDTVLFGDQVNFYTYPCGIEFYCTEPGEYEIINESKRTISLIGDNDIDIPPEGRITINIDAWG